MVSHQGANLKLVYDNCGIHKHVVVCVDLLALARLSSENRGYMCLFVGMPQSPQILSNLAEPSPIPTHSGDSCGL